MKPAPRLVPSAPAFSYGLVEQLELEDRHPGLAVLLIERVRLAQPAAMRGAFPKVRRLKSLRP